MDHFLSIEAFVNAVDAGGITAAAEKLAVSKSVVSKRITDLEGRIGVRLLHRGSRRLSLTAAGSTYYDQARRAIADLHEAEKAAAGEDAEPRGVLRIAAPMSFGTLQLKQLTYDFMQRWPDLMIDLDMNDRVVDLVAEGHDLAVRLGRLRDSGLVARTIAPNRHIICASPAYAARRGLPETPEALRDHDGLLYTLREAHGMWQVISAGELKSYRIRSRMRCNNGEVLQGAALAGLGLAILPTFMAAPHIRNGELLPVLGDHELPGGSISAVYVRGRSLPAKVRVFIDALVAAYNPVPAWDEMLGR